MFSLTLYLGAHVSPVIFVFKEQAGATQAKATVDAAMIGIGPAEFRSEHSHVVRIADDFGHEGTFRVSDIAGCMLQDAEKARMSPTARRPNQAGPQQLAPR